MKHVWKISLGLAGLNLTVALLVMFLKNKLPPVIPLYYGLPQGEQQLVQNAFLVIPSLVACGFSIINGVIANFVKKDFLTNSLLTISFTLSAFAIVSVSKIFFLVGNF